MPDICGYSAKLIYETSTVPRILYSDSGFLGGWILTFPLKMTYHDFFSPWDGRYHKYSLNAENPDGYIFAW